MGTIKPYRIVHLSDLHLTPSDNIGRTEVSLPGKNLYGMNEVFRKILKTNNIQESDLILITGDITDVGDRKSWKVFQMALKDSGVEKKTFTRELKQYQSTTKLSLECYRRQKRTSSDGNRDRHKSFWTLWSSR